MCVCVRAHLRVCVLVCGIESKDIIQFIVKCLLSTTNSCKIRDSQTNQRCSGCIVNQEYINANYCYF